MKRSIDLVGAICALAVTGPIISCTAVIARWDTGQSGLFRQTRVGKHGQNFEILKLRTMRDMPSCNTTVTTSDDPRITRWGRFFRKSKLDELPQLINVLRGEMSFVGPRPDVPSQWEHVPMNDKEILLSVAPGITGPASLKYRDEEQLLATQSDPDRFNSTVLFPDKVRINKQYITNYSFWRDCIYLADTFIWKGLATHTGDKSHESFCDPASEFQGTTKPVVSIPDTDDFHTRRAA